MRVSLAIDAINMFYALHAQAEKDRDDKSDHPQARSGSEGAAAPAATPPWSRAAELRLMYVLDTNVLSSIVKETPDATVAEWLKACPIEWVFTTVICQSELLYGVRRLPESRRRHRLQGALGSLFSQVLAGRLLVFDEAAASAYADIRIARGCPGGRHDRRDRENRRGYAGHKRRNGFRGSASS